LGLTVYVESLLNRRLADFLIRRGYQYTDQDQHSAFLPCRS
jgi:hypothetical protein